MDVNGSFEYVYIMTTTDSLNIQTMRKIGFDFIARHFNVSNATRADIETSSPEDGIIFKGFIPKIIYKYNRWKGSEWKYKLCYNENRWSSFWRGVWAHLLKPGSIQIEY